MSEGLTISDLVAMVRGRAVLVASIGLLGIAAAVQFARSLPPVYATSARVLIEHQQISDELVRSTVNLSAAHRLQLIQERLMARDSLTDTIDRLALFRDKALTPTEKIARLRAATRIESTTGATQAWGAESPLFAFSISVEWGDPVEAAAIANEFVESAINQNLEVRARQARDTLLYLEAEERRIDGALRTLEAEFAAFKKANEPALPESLEFRRSELQRLEVALLENDRRILDLEAELGGLRLKLEGGASVRPDAPLSPAEITLGELEVELAQKRLLLAPNHPEIGRLRSRIAAIEQIVAPNSARSEARGGPLREQERRSTAAQIEQVSARLQLARDQRESNLQARAALEASLRRTPELEVTVNRYDRDLSELQEQKKAVAQLLEEASKGEQLEANRQSERFQVLETALVPDKPIGPSRLKYAVLGSGVSVVGSIALALGLGFLHPVLRSAADMERRVGIRPVIALPYIRTRAERRRRALVAVSCGVVLCSAILVALSSGLAGEWGSGPELLQAVAAVLGAEQGGASLPWDSSRAD